ISNANWQHNVNHRGAVPYRDNASRQKYGTYDRQAAQAREQFRGREGNVGGSGLNDRSGLQNAANRGAGSRDAAGFGGGNASANRPGGGGAAGANRDLGASAGGHATRTSSAAANRGGGFNVSNGAQA